MGYTIDGACVKDVREMLYRSTFFIDFYHFISVSYVLEYFVNLTRLKFISAIRKTGLPFKQSTLIITYSLVILKLDLELIATESPFAPNNYLSDPNQHIKSLPKSTRRKIVNLLEHFQLICIISKGLLVCGFWNVKKAQLKINVKN